MDLPEIRNAVERLRSQLAEAAQGKRFLLQGGACAERFDQCSAETITNKLKILLQIRHRPGRITRPGR